ncbi:uncharacterized protein LOC116173113 [Photinus pyralis]|uniref:uncharacterized protein LOC116173113 n=1 Tax=Photinus pyralis TaxID=7054 RepID=UPI0012678025|nr:uncharacterized protein LOC116173113 [Photinus pyralis]
MLPKHKIHNTIKLLKQKIDTQDLIVTSADKNAGLVILNKIDYINKTLQFFDENNITEIPKNPINKFSNKVNKTILESKTTLEKLNSNPFIIKNRNPQTPFLYSILKLHKQNHPIRPITASYESPTYKLAKFLNHTLTQLLQYKSHQSIKNSTQLIHNINKITPLQPNSIMISFDIVNLYTNIPIHNTLSILSDILYNHDSFRKNFKLNPIDIQNLLKLFDLTTQQNFFTFNSKYYQMQDGLPMGSPISGILANIFIDHLENKIKLLPEFNNIAIWNRYVDDIFCIWTGTITELHQFHIDINNLSKIKFTIEIEQNNKLNFLDLTLHKDNNHIHYNIYRKPTTTDIVIPHNSYHSPQIKRSAFNFLFNRLISTPLNKIHYNEEYNTILQIALNNKYNFSFIHNIYRKIKQQHIINTIFPHHNVQKTFKAITYNHTIHNKINKIFNKHNINIIPKSQPTIKKILTNIKPKTPAQQKSGIYQIFCNQCPASYIGLTTRNLGTRFKEHSKNQPKSAIGTHIKDSQHSISIDKAKILQTSNNYNQLKILEHLEIHKAIKQPNHNLLNEITFFPEQHLYKRLHPFNNKDTQPHIHAHSPTDPT